MWVGMGVGEDGFDGYMFVGDCVCYVVLYILFFFVWFVWLFDYCNDNYFQYNLVVVEDWVLWKMMGVVVGMDGGFYGCLVLLLLFLVVILWVGIGLLYGFWCY